MKKDILIVDGYNVIFAWPELKVLSDQSLEHARLHLRELLQNYGRHQGFLVILVFDGTYAAVTASVTELSPDFLEIYTGEEETADSFIEREVFQRKDHYDHVYVVTSDGAEQHQVLGSGGLRIPARELRHNVQLAKKEEKAYYHESGVKGVPMVRNEVAGLVPDDVAAKLEALRRSKKP